MIYFIRCQLTKLVKIGYTNQDEVAERLKNMQVGSPGELLIVGAMAGYFTEERVLQGKYADKHVRGEWFALTDEDLAKEPLEQPGYIQAGRENDAWQEARFKEAAINNERRGSGMQAEMERWEQTFLDEMPPKERRAYIEEMSARWRELKKKRKESRAHRIEPRRS